jgi:hypothetical protein
MRPGELVVQCAVHDEAGALVERRLVRVRADAPASAVLAVVLRLSLAERRRGRILTVVAPEELVALLGLCGLGGDADEVRR